MNIFDDVPEGWRGRGKIRPRRLAYYILDERLFLELEEKGELKDENKKVDCDEGKGK